MTKGIFKYILTFLNPLKELWPNLLVVNKEINAMITNIITNTDEIWLEISEENDDSGDPKIEDNPYIHNVTCEYPICLQIKPKQLPKYCSLFKNIESGVWERDIS